ncbi:MAG: glycosyltransferase family 1 protein, partial [bacterium]
LPLYLLTHPRHDVWWSPAHYLPFYSGSPSVVTIHDLAYEFFPELFLSSDLYKLKNWTREAVKKASRVIAVSEATKNDLVRLYNVPEEKIEVIHNGYSSDIFNLSRPASSAILSTYHLKTNNYLLFVGTVQPRKNVTKLVQAFRLLKSSGYKGKLVIAGKIGWLAEETLGVIKNSEDAKDIVMTGYISNDAQATLYRHADVFVLPSLYEGFGVPVLEAMACGTPVTAANNSSLPEVVGEAGVLFNATDAAGLAESIRQLHKERDKWVKKGLDHVKSFSWDKCAKETLEVLVNIAKSGR